MNALALAAVGAGAACGAWFRWALGSLLNAAFPPMPYGTLAANLLGSFLMGLALILIVDRQVFAPEFRLAVTVGFLASFTTMSTFAGETMTLILRAEYLVAAGLVTLHVAGSILMVFAGVMLARAVSGS